MLTVSDLHVAYGDATVVQAVDLQVATGTAVAVIGSNGAGKTTLLRAVVGLLRPASGTVTYDGSSVVGTATHELANRGMVYVPAERRLFPGMTVRENLELGAYPNRPDPRQEAMVLELFPLLAVRRKQLVGTMSGGEQQMVAVGRALMSRPQLLVLDEPTTGLAPTLAEEAYRSLRELRAQGMTILVAEQQVPLALRLADRGYVLEHGRVQLEGTGAELRSDPDVRRAYFGVT